MAELTAKQGDDIRESVRARYAEAARAAATGSASCCGSGDAVEQADSCGCSPDPLGAEQGVSDFGAALYSTEDRKALPEQARLASLGCGNPTAVADLREGETVLDLGSGGGIDVLLSAQRVGPAGKAYGLDMTDEMLALARENQREAGIENAEFVRGSIEQIPLADSSVDVIISNCVINLSGDKPRVFGEAARVLRPGGRFAVTDVVADPEMDEATRRDMAQWTGCIAGALTVDQFQTELAAAGFTDVEVRETHRVHEHAGSAIVRARKPTRG
jgi:ubiquinone/menaquinone biosynthesis C-methylase UbiE